MSKVLIIDDEALLRDSLSAYLEDDGHQVISTAKAESALTKFPNFKPDIVVVDLRLEGASGEEFIKAASKIDPHCHYIIHTACKDYHLPNDLLALGMKDTQVLFKPVRDLGCLSGLISHLIPQQAISSAGL